LGFARWADPKERALSCFGYRTHEIPIIERVSPINVGGFPS
jgi:hypothetical protein